jgi:HPt (histidine-containing phosphotransfer) domain-containing protein
MTPKELYDRIGGDYEAAKRTMMTDAMISRFIVKLIDDKSYSRLMAAAETMDSVGLFEASHAMKGVYANLGLTNLSAAASELTEEFRAGTERTLSDEAVKEKIDAITAMYEEAVEGVKQFVQEQ